MDYPFLRQAAQIFNAGLSRSLVLYGNIYDSFYFSKEDERDQAYNLVDLIIKAWDLPDVITITYELNGPIKIHHEAHRHALVQAWDQWSLNFKDFIGTYKQPRLELLDKLERSTGKPTMSLELLRQIFYVSREMKSKSNSPLSGKRLVLIVESADLLIPPGQGDITSLPLEDRQRLMILYDWFSDPSFTQSDDNVILLSETRHSLHPKLTGLPQLKTLQVPLPDFKMREAFFKNQSDLPQLSDEKECQKLAYDTSGLSQHALKQLCIVAKHANRKITSEDLNKLLQQRIEESLGPDVIEFKKPNHRLSDLIGNKNLLDFIRQRLIPRLLSTDPKRALPGFAVSGPIRGGKTYIFEAVAAELGIPVITLKSIRSQWFGQTDVIIEKLLALLSSLGKAMIFIDEADTQFGSLSKDSHDTEKRLTGKFQQIMSDPKLKGKLIWVLVTARIDRLSPDIRGPGRAGGLIIPVLDPLEEDLTHYLNWMAEPVLGRALSTEELETLTEIMKHEKAYAGAIMALKAELEDEKNHLNLEHLTFETIVEVINRYLPPPIKKTRRIQTLFALLNCTRKDLIPEEYCQKDIYEQRELWQKELDRLNQP